MDDLLKRYLTALGRIGINNLLNLPEPVAEALKETTNLETKVRMLEEIAKAK